MTQKENWIAQRQIVMEGTHPHDRVVRMLDIVASRLESLVHTLRDRENQG